MLNEPVEARYFRLHVTDVLKEESDLSLYYQNVSVQELEVYGQLEDCFVVETPVIEAGSRRTLELPTVPEPYSISFGGADYDVLVNMDGAWIYSGKRRRNAGTAGNTDKDSGIGEGGSGRRAGGSTGSPLGSDPSRGLYRDGVDAGERNRCN